MQKTKKHNAALWTVLLCAALTALGFVLYSGNLMKTAALLMGALAVWMLATRSVAPLRSPYVWPLLGYAAFAGLAGLWAVDGSLHLEGYLQVFTAACLFLILLLRKRFDAAFVRRVLGVVAVTAGIYAFLSVEAATTGLMKAILTPLLGAEVPILFNGRLFGVFGNPNIEASIFAFGVTSSLALLDDARERRERMWYAVTLSLCAYALLLGFSMGALFSFAVGIVLYLVFSAERRPFVFAHMLIGALPSAVFALAASRCAGHGGAVGKLPLLLAIANAAVCAALELRVFERLAATVAKREKLVIALPLALAALAAVYLAVGLAVRETSYTFGETLGLSASVSPGEHTLVIDADNPVTSIGFLQSEKEVMSYDGHFLFYGETDPTFSFTAPEGSYLLNFSFFAEPGTKIRSISLDGEPFTIEYPLLPSYVAGRLSNIGSDVNARSRREMMRDGLLLWRERPVAGGGLGAFEVGAPRVQRNYYQTKYVHNHYIQTLAETGLIGLLLWLGALAASVAALWRKRRDAEHPCRWAYGALWAAMAQIIVQTVTDVSLSFCVVLWYVYAIFAVILRVYAVDGTANEALEEPPKSDKKAREAAERKRRSAERTLRAGAIAPLAVLLLTFSLSAAAEYISGRPAATLGKLLDSIATAETLDLYKKADYKYYYALTTVQPEALELVTAEERARANGYAADLAKQESGSYAQSLVTYYLTTEQYELAVKAAKRAAVLLPRDTTWAQVTDALREAFDKPVSPLLGPDGAALLNDLAEYRTLLDEHNAWAWTIHLSLENTTFLEKAADACIHANDATYLAALFGGA